MNKNNSSENESLRDRVCASIKQSFPGRIALSPEEFSSLVNRQKLWGYRRIWSGDIPALGAEEGKRGRNKSTMTQRYQILIEEAADYFVRTSSNIGRLKMGSQAGPVLSRPRETNRSGTKAFGKRADVRNYVVTMLDEADHSILIQFVKAKKGADAGNYALRFDESGEAREDGYKLVSVLSSEDFESLKDDLDNFRGEPIGPTKASEDDDTTMLGVFVSD